MLWNQAHIEIDKKDKTVILWNDNDKPAQPKSELISYSPAQTCTFGRRDAYGHLILKVPAHENILGDERPNIYQIWLTYDDPESAWKYDIIKLNKCKLLDELPIG